MHVAAGALIFKEGQHGDQAYLIERGAVEIWTDRTGERICLARLGPGDLFGERAVLGDAIRSASATALEATRLTLINSDHLRQRLRDADPIIGLIVKQLLQNPERGVVTFGPPSDPLAVEKMRLESALEAALKGDLLHLYYQPIVDLNGGGVIGAEALVRWEHPTRGWINPQAMVLLAEETSLIRSLDRWVVTRACQDLFALRAMVDAAAFRVNVNLSAQEVGWEGFIDDVSTIVMKEGLSPHDLKLEITESALVQAVGAAAWVRRCQAAGFDVVIDDFGTGYSSLAYLMDLSVDILKIDQAFVRSLMEVPRAAPVIRAITQMAAALEMDVVVEGIEDTQTAKRLADLGCHYGQGYLYARPLSREHLADWLRSMP
ncbi:MAG: EAL domain-containing protein [Myxococcota bacterium]